MGLEVLVAVRHKKTLERSIVTRTSGTNRASDSLPFCSFESRWVRHGL